MYDALRTAYRVDVTRSLDAFQLGLERVRDHQHVVCAPIRVLGPQRRRHDRYVVDALGFHERRHDAETLRSPVLVGVDGVVQPDQCLGSRLANPELHGQHTDARPRHRIDVLDAVDLGQHLLHRNGHEVLDLDRRCARKRDEHVGERDVDLRFLLARRHHHREYAHEQRGQRQERCERVVLESPGNTAG